jgi:peptide/nickel transport system ATP-binding protein
MTDTILEVRDLSIDFDGDEGAVRAVDGVNFTIQRGEILGLVGESGAGKTLTSEAILRLIRCPPGRITGEILYRGRNLLQLGEAELADIRGKEIAMIFQNPIPSLNPVFRVGEQLLETLALHLPGRRRTLRQKAIDILTRVGIPLAERRAEDYPHQFSGGMCQRAMIGMGIACAPSLLVADEPTTALDVTIQAQILYEAQKLCRESGTALIWITHDLSVVAGLADRICVMYAGRIVEQGTVDEVLDAPLHPYTHGLIGSVPSRNRRGTPLAQIPGMTPALLNLPPGCAFRTRCPRAAPACSNEPALEPHGGNGRLVRCFYPMHP